jgi:hypothetical protein
MKRISAFASALMLAAVAVACSSTDAGITTNVKSKFAVDDTVKAYEIDVTTRNGVVTLSGDVDSAAAKEQAVLIARSTEGVADVVDNLVITPETAATGGLDDNDVDVGVDIDNDVERQAERAGEAIERGADATADAARRAAERARDAVTDDDPDSDNDGQ